MRNTTIKSSAGDPADKSNITQTGPAPIGAAALIGLPGEVVKELGPHTESDPAAVLIQLLAAFGSIIGRTAHLRIGGVIHYLNLFVVLVGQSSKSRKGTSWAEVVRLFTKVAGGAWFRNRVKSGLSSGEGLIYAVRDTGTVQTSAGKLVNVPGVQDKRLLVKEGEFAAVLKTMRREGNVLSPLLRQAWDGEILQSMTKASPLIATGAHISLVGHVTSHELIRNLSETEQANGFANRILWPLIHRSKFLPFGGALAEEVLEHLQDYVCCAVEAARAVGRIELSAAAAELWCQHYPQLSRDRDGLTGAMTSRAEAQVMRLSALYAAMDGSQSITPEHLLAGLEVWRYCEDSVELLFGDALGDPAADELLRQLRATPSGLTRTEISRIWKGNKAAAEIDRALRLLADRGLAHSELDETGGRPAERWFETMAALEVAHG